MRLRILDAQRECESSNVRDRRSRFVKTLDGSISGDGAGCLTELKSGPVLSTNLVPIAGAEMAAMDVRGLEEKIYY